MQALRGPLLARTNLDMRTVDSSLSHPYKDTVQENVQATTPRYGAKRAVSQTQRGMQRIGRYRIRQPRWLPRSNLAALSSCDCATAVGQWPFPRGTHPYGRTVSRRAERGRSLRVSWPSPRVGSV